jgi:hypothetical protein
LMKGIPGASFHTLHFEPGAIVASGDELYVLKHLNPSPASQRVLEAKFDAMQLTVKYQCLYGEDYTAVFKRGVSNAV